jgi:hypothetical protein
MFCGCGRSKRWVCKRQADAPPTSSIHAHIQVHTPVVTDARQRLACNRKSSQQAGTPKPYIFTTSSQRLMLRPGSTNTPASRQDTPKQRSTPIAWPPPICLEEWLKHSDRHAHRLPYWRMLRSKTRCLTDFAYRITFRNSLRSSSLQEPNDPLPTVVNN